MVKLVRVFKESRLSANVCGVIGVEWEEAVNGDSRLSGVLGVFCLFVFSMYSNPFSGSGSPSPANLMVLIAPLGYGMLFLWSRELPTGFTSFSRLTENADLRE